MSRLRHLGLVALFGLAACERQEITVPTGMRGEAARNPLLAAERTLERLGVGVESRKGVLPLPSTETRVCVSGAPFFVEGRRLDEFLDWVERGGHALVCLDGFGAPRGADGEMDPVDELEAVDRVPPRGALERELGVYRLPWNEDPDWLAMIEGFDVDLPAESGWLTDGASDAAGSLVIDRGVGSLRLLPSGRPFNNYVLGDFDHALALDEWLGDAPTVLVVLDEEDSLWRLLTERAPEALWVSLVLLGLWLWSAARRFGPVETLPEAAVHGFTLHVAAAGRFLWRHDRGPALLGALRERTLRRAERSLLLSGRAAHRGPFAPANTERASRRALLAALAQRTGRSEDDLDVLLFSAEAVRPRDLTALVRDLVHLHREL